MIRLNFLIEQVFYRIQHQIKVLTSGDLHPPFIFRFYNEVLKSDRQPRNIGQIHQIRKKLRRNTEQVNQLTIGAPSRVLPASSNPVSKIARYGVSPHRFANLLYKIATFNESETLVELGTALGTTTLYLSSVSSAKQVFTLEGNPDLAQVSQQVFDSWPEKNIILQRGNIDDTLPNLLSKTGQIDFVYIDANHRYEATLRYFNGLLPYMSENGIMVFDDIYWSAEMRQAWQEIHRSNQVSLSIDLFRAGVIFFHPLRKKQHYFLNY